MPHFHIEYSANLEEMVDMAALCDHLRRAAIATGVFPMPGVRIRAFNHTGAGQSDQFVASSFARQVARIRLGRQEASLRVGNLDSVRDFLHVDDVLDAYVALLDPSVPAAVYNVAGERATPIRDVLDRLVALAGVAPRVEVDPDRFRPTDWLVGDSSRLTRATGWRPRTSLDAILRELYEHWLAAECRET